ncbi:MAG: cryptochrome/photolyase family protein [Marinicaulis sp.]|nr:cryptochrome/photolyase family protein [Marinicaulis sp.]NNE42518.1 cryptochrome/photolyase family protein [Marinicaulis sp.]NNL88967.1 cryptochrome/photolyase family protein [Marinicaulis sp.]
MRNLIFILGDQLSHNIASLKNADRDCDRVLMVEVMDEATYVGHHKKKIAFLFSAMRHFAEELKSDGWNVGYIKLNDPGNTASFTGELKRACERHCPERIIAVEAGEYRVKAAMENWQEETGVRVKILEDDRFLCSQKEFQSWADGRKSLRMEYFYREMRKKTGFLMDGEEPAGGKWNFDAENRKPAKAELSLPRPRRMRVDDITRDVLDLVRDNFAENFGDLEPFWFAVTREKAEAALDAFIREGLPSFGDFQDAMLEGEKFLYHSVLSLYINAGLLDPHDVCRRVERAYLDGDAPINAAEGFVRQIIGWREYVRGIYWLNAPNYVDQNYFGAERPLPEFYWTGETRMNCVRASVAQTKEEAYAHHIQRLMVTGNFAMLAGVDPQAVHEWYLGVYADAFEWVEAPNTFGMSQFADGGLLASKPYAASGNYINKMSNYCEGCEYDVKKKTGEGACPFNPLYWDFLVRNRNKLKNNRRLSRAYSTWDRMDSKRQKEYRDSANRILDRL